MTRMTSSDTNSSGMMGGEERKPIPCGGCGATSGRCIGCLHDFGIPESAWVREYAPGRASKPDRSIP